MSPSDLGALIKPFVFLDHFDVDRSNAPRFGWHPHSGIATLTLLLEGGTEYEDSTGASGTMDDGSVEWMQAGGGVWHTGNGIGPHIKGYQLWVALPPESETGPALSRYFAQARFPEVGPARVILGDLDGARSPIQAPSPMNYFEVRLKAGEVWRYDPPADHEVAWMAVHRGRALAGDAIDAGELVVFSEENTAIHIRADGDTQFVLGSAMKHPFDLVLGYYSVHTHADFLTQGEANIESIGAELRRQKKL